MSILREYEKQFDVPPKKQNWLDLDRMKKLMEKLGNPEKDLKGVHVAGTNGKGSTCAMTQSILTQAGYRVGMFSSPHIYDLRERFRIGYNDIPEKKLAKYFERIKPYLRRFEAPASKCKDRKVLQHGRREAGASRRREKLGDSPTWFEILTCIAILYFRDEKVDVVIFEVGLGGRLDATNVLNPGICAITDISLDHQEYLGNTIAKIAREKAGIIKPDSVVLTSNQGEALRVIEKVCHGNRIYKTDKIDKSYKLSLQGEHQKRNAGLVLEIIKELKKKGLKTNKQDIKKGLRNVKWPARFQILDSKFKVPIIIDCAHNPAGMKTLVKTFKEQGHKKAIVLFSAKKSKDVRTNLRVLKPIVKEIFFATIPDLDFMYKPSTLKKFCSKGKIEKDVRIALKKAKDLARKNDLPILICGSMYSISYIRKFL